jgi:phosphoribosyl-ATP pyrophosphohydrolase/phosphoribosyl-AMP cyclohydrolase
VSCFGDAALAPDALSVLDSTISARSTAATSPEAPSYTRRLLGDRNLRLKKIGEEAAELVTACADGDLDRAREEAADLFYHALVALHALGGTLGDVRAVLASRAGRPAR